MKPTSFLFIVTLTIFALYGVSCQTGLFSNVESEITGSWTSTPVDSALIENWFFSEDGRLFVSRNADTALFYFQPLDTILNYLEYTVEKETLKSYVTVTKLGQNLNIDVGPIGRKYEIVTLKSDELYLASEDLVNGEIIVGNYQRSFTK